MSHALKLLAQEPPACPRCEQPMVASILLQRDATVCFVRCTARHCRYQAQLQCDGKPPR